MMYSILKDSNTRLKAIILAALAAGISTESIAGTVRGLTEPVRDVEMSTIVPGTVAKIHLDEGSFVEKGNVVLELESRSEELDIQRRAVLVETLKNTLERSEKLLQNTSSISMEEVDEARSDYQVAVLELELAREALNKKQLRAPFTGIVTRLHMQEGEYCEPPQIIIRLVDTREFFCVANIDPDTALQLKVDDPVRFRPDTGTPGLELPGRIVFISPVVDPASGLLRIEALIPNRDNAVRPGEGGLLELPTSP